MNNFQVGLQSSPFYSYNMSALCWTDATFNLLFEVKVPRGLYVKVKEILKSTIIVWTFNNQIFI